MFGIGMPEMLLILAIALIVIGPKKLPDLAKSLGRAFSEFKQATSELKDSIEIENGFEDIKQTFDDIDTDIRETIDVNTTPSGTLNDPPPRSSSDDDPNKQSEIKPAPTALKDEAKEKNEAGNQAIEGTSDNERR